MKIPIEMLKEIRESGYDKQLVYHYIRELLDSEKKKFPKENNNPVSYTHLRAHET